MSKRELRALAEDRVLAVLDACKRGALTDTAHDLTYKPNLGVRFCNLCAYACEDGNPSNPPLFTEHATWETIRGLAARKRVAFEFDFEIGESRVKLL